MKKSNSDNNDRDNDDINKNKKNRDEITPIKKNKIGVYRCSSVAKMANGNMSPVRRSGARAFPF